MKKQAAVPGKKGFKARMLSEENIFLAIYMLDSYILNQELLSPEERNQLHRLKDIFDGEEIGKTIRTVRDRIQKLLADAEDYFEAEVYFKPKKQTETGTVFRPLHTASLTDQIAMTAMLQALVYDIGTDGTLLPSELSRSLPSHFYGNRISYDGKRLFKPWTEQYQEYTKKANDYLGEFSKTSAYKYEVSLDLENFFPSIDPQILFYYIRSHLSVKWEKEDIAVIEKTLRKLLIFKLRSLTEEEWRWYRNGEAPQEGKGSYVKGLPQGLPHTYFMANFFMLLVQKEFEKVFPGKMLFYVDDSVIFTNEELTEEGFRESIDKLNANLRTMEEGIRRKNRQFVFYPQDYCYESKDYGVRVHEPGEKSIYEDIMEADKNSGEIYLKGLSRETSNISFDFSTIFLDEDVEMMLSRTTAILEQIEIKLERIGGEKDVQRKKLIRYKKFFSYRKTILSYRSNGQLSALLEEITRDMGFSDGLDHFFEKYNDDILAAAIQFVFKRCWDENVDPQKLADAVRELSAELYSGSRDHAYLLKAYEPYLEGKPEFFSVDPYGTLNEKMTARYHGVLEQTEENKRRIFRKELLRKDMDALCKMFDLEPLDEYAQYVLDNSDELERRILNAAFSYLFQYNMDDRFVFAKKSRRPILYSELRVLSALKNGDFSLSAFWEDYSAYTGDGYHCTADHSLLQVLERFRVFVKKRDRIDKLILVHKYCCDTWKNGSKHLHFYTLHNQEHAVTLIQKAVQWLHAISYFNLKQNDYFVLFAACYLHDISMVSLPQYAKFYTTRDPWAVQILTELLAELDEMDTLRSQQALYDAYQKIDAFFEHDLRSHHAENSAREIRTFRELDFIENDTREFIGRVSEAHGYDTGDVYAVKSRGSTELINEKLLKILLRLSDLLDMSRYRISELILNHNLEMLNEESRFHWISHLITDCCEISTEYKSLLGPFSGPEEPGPLERGSIEEKLILTIDVLMSQMTEVEKPDPCPYVQSSVIRKLSDPVSLVITCDRDSACGEKQCNFLCRWFTLKNNYLLKELAELKAYLNQIPDNFFRSEIEIHVRVVTDTRIPNDVFDYLRDYVTKDRKE